MSIIKNKAPCSFFSYSTPLWKTDVLCVIIHWLVSIGIGRNINIIGTFVLINREKLPHATQHEKWVQQPLARKTHIYQKRLLCWTQTGTPRVRTVRSRTTERSWEVYTPERMESQPSVIRCRYINQTNAKSNYGVITKCTLSQAKLLEGALARSWESAKFYWPV